MKMTNTVDGGKIGEEKEELELKLVVGKLTKVRRELIFLRLIKRTL